MWLTKMLLATIGLAYLMLAAWCVARPQQTAGAVGFELKPGGGQSEYLVIYGGLQLALGIVFLLPLVREQFLPFALLACLIVHAALVLFRTISFVLYSDIPTTTYVLATVEWAILLLTAWRFFIAQPS